MLRIPLKDDVRTLDPANAYDSVSLAVLGQVVESLYEYDYQSQTASLLPNLAASQPEWSANGRTVVIRLKQGVHFQDDPCFKDSSGKGRALTASDFLYAWKRLAIPSLRSPGLWIFEGKVTGYQDFMRDLMNAKDEAQFQDVFEKGVSGFRALDEHTIQISLDRPYPQLTSLLAMPFTAPVPKEAIATYADSEGNWDDHPVGTGPYLLRSWISKQGVVLAKNPVFRVPNTPKIDELHFEILKEESPRFVKFMRGDLDLLEIPNDNFASAMSDAKTLHPDLAKKGIGVSIEDTLIAYWVGFNMKDKTLSNKFLRQAISSAIDRDKWLQLFEMGRGTLQTQMAPPGISDRSKSTTLKYGYDLGRAKALMIKAGHPGGAGLPILRFDFRGSNEQSEKLGKFFQAQLKEIGLKIEVRLNTFPAYLEKAKKGDLQIFLDGWSLDYPDIENMLQLLYGKNPPPGSNRSNFINAEYDSLYSKLTGMQPGPARQALVERMEAIVQEECPWAYGYYQRKYKLFQPWVKNFHSAELVPNTYKYLDVTPRP